MTTGKLPSVFQTMALDPTARRDPHPRLDQLRSECPVMFDAQQGSFFLTRYDDVKGVLSDLSHWRDPRKADPEAKAFNRLLGSLPKGSQAEKEYHSSLILLDDPDHARLRSPIAQTFYRRIGGCRPMVEGIVTGVMDSLDGVALFDAVSQFAARIPIEVLAKTLGVDRERLPEFRRWSEDSMLIFHPIRTAAETSRMLSAQDALRAYLLDLIAARRKEPADDFVSDMVVVQTQGADISDSELQINLRALLNAGVTTTADLIGSAIWLLLSNPDQLVRLRASPSLAAATIEEALRFEPPVDMTTRIASRDMEMAGCPIRKNQVLSVSIRAANRDPSTYEDPHRFDISARRRPHAAFGGGSHICIGAPLARLEAQIAILALISRHPRLRLAGDAPPQWRALPMFRGLSRLDVRVD